MFTRLQIVVCFLFIFLQAYSQLPQEKDFIQRFIQADTDEEKITALGNLAELYSVYKDSKKADSILEKQMLLAELSQDENLILKTISGNAISNISRWSSKETFDHAMTFLHRALSHAKQQNNAKLEAVIYLRMANLLRKRNLFDQAMEQIALVFSLLDKKQDSLKSVLYLELGESFLGKGDAVSAYKNFNSAYDISYSIKNISLQSTVWHCFSELYKNLGDTTLAKNALFESLRLNIKHQHSEGLLSDYIDLFRLTDAFDFLNKALFLADSLSSFSNQLYCKRLLLSYMMVVEKNSGKALAYLQKNKDLQLHFANEGLPNYNIGAIYHYSGQYDQAISYYLRDEPSLLKTFDLSVQLSFFCEVADCYMQINKTEKAIEYYEKAFTISKSSGRITTNALVTSKLSQLYAKKGEFKSAFDFSRIYQNYHEELKALAKQREVTLLGLEREKRKHEKDVQSIADEDVRRRNLQYTGISLATAFLFIVLIVFGMFPISKATIRMLNFFSFICLFEFIILLIDNWLHDITHAQPLKIWLAKIFIIAILLPLHHTLEHVTIKFLSSQKLQKFRQGLSIKRFLHPTKKQIRKIENTLEESPLI
jgi:tetratricopeptide (TPR) repeat protein